eukprot:26244_1
MKENIITKYPLICLSSLNSECITFPIDSIKTTMQINNNNVTFTRTGYGMIQSNGFKCIYKGLQAAILRHWIYTGLRISLYEHMRGYLYKNGYSKHDLSPKIISSLCAGSIAQLIASPTDLIKIRMISNIHNNPRIMSTITNIYTKHGLFAFYKGCAPNVLRAASVNLGELASYDMAKRFVLSQRNNKEDQITFSLSSFISGFCSAFLSTPADNIKSRIMATNTTHTNGIMHSIMKSIQCNGFRSLYIGFFPNWLRLAPWQFIFWNSYEYYRIWFGIKGF